MPRRSSRERRSSPSTRLASDRSSSEMAEGPSAGTARVVSCSRGLEYHSLGDVARRLRATLVPLQRRSSTVHAHEERHSLGNEGRARETARLKDAYLRTECRQLLKATRASLTRSGNRSSDTGKAASSLQRECRQLFPTSDNATHSARTRSGEEREAYLRLLSICTCSTSVVSCSRLA